MAVHPLLLLDTFIGRVAIRTENNTAIAVCSYLLVNLLWIPADDEPNSSVKPTD
jgi:hypothetical protein